MIRAIVLIICLVFVFTGCSNVDVYTFKKDRVDQKVDGNQGFLEGKSQGEAAQQTENKKRTLISIDIGVESYGPLNDEVVEDATTRANTQATKPVTNIEPKNAPKKQAPVVEVVEVEEEEWIK